MTNYENFKLTWALGNAHQKINLPDFDKNTPLTTALKTPLTTHLSTPSSLSPLFFTYFSNTNPYLYICIFLQYNHLRTIYSAKNKTTHQLSTLASFSSLTQTVPSSHLVTTIHYH